MKKEYVTLQVEIVNIQLSDCIAGSASNISVSEGTSVLNEVDGSGYGSGDGKVRFGTW